MFFIIVFLFFLQLFLNFFSNVSFYYFKLFLLNFFSCIVVFFICSIFFLLFSNVVCCLCLSIPIVLVFRFHDNNLPQSLSRAPAIETVVSKLYGVNATIKYKYHSSLYCIVLKKSEYKYNLVYNVSIYLLCCIVL